MVRLLFSGELYLEGLERCLTGRGQSLVLPRWLLREAPRDGAMVPDTVTIWLPTADRQNPFVLTQLHTYYFCCCLYDYDCCYYYRCYHYWVCFRILKISLRTQGPLEYPILGEAHWEPRRLINTTTKRECPECIQNNPERPEWRLLTITIPS